MSKKQLLFCITFLGHNKSYELYVRSINQSDIFGFIEIADFVFGEHSQLVVDPAEEQLKLEFSAVKRTLIPMQAVLRIDEVQKEGVAKITPVNTSNIAQFPTTMFNAPNNESGKKT